MYAVAFFPLTLLLMFTVLNYYFIYPKLYPFLEQTDNAAESNNTTEQPPTAINRTEQPPRATNSTEQPPTATNSINTTEQPPTTINRTEQPLSATNRTTEQPRMSNNNHSAAEMIPIAATINKISHYGATNRDRCIVEIDKLNTDANSIDHTTETNIRAENDEDHTKEPDNIRAEISLLLEVLYDKDMKKAHTRALLSFSIALHIFLTIIYGLSIWKFFEYYDELFCHTYDFNDDDNSDCVTGDHLIPFFQVVVSAIIIFFVDLLLFCKAIKLFWKAEEDYLLRFTLSSLGASITIVGVYFAPYILLALITAPLQTIFFYVIVTILLIVCYFFFLVMIPLCYLVYPSCCSRFVSCFQSSYSRFCSFLQCCCFFGTGFLCCPIHFICCARHKLRSHSCYQSCFHSYFQSLCYTISCYSQSHRFFKFCHSQLCKCFSKFPSCSQSSCFSKFCELLILIGATVSIAYFFIIFYLVLTLGDINNFQDAQNGLYGLLILLLSIFILKPLYKYLKEKNNKESSSKSGEMIVQYKIIKLIE